ncbi:MAG TPA: flavin reductase family protein [Bryobacteraceae bacterium]|nr:flavin reductase family protein [Bryobacteraceae bacterium]
MSSKPARRLPARFPADEFRRTCARFPSGVTILTVFDAAGAPHGMTASSFTSVSLEPPLVLVCVDHRATVMAHLKQCEFFGINILAEGQHELSTRFSRRKEDRFEGIEWTGGRHGVPVIPDMLASFECSMHRLVDAGDHAIVLGEVLHAEHREGRPLVYFGSGYHRLDGTHGG